MTTIEKKNQVSQNNVASSEGATKSHKKTGELDTLLDSHSLEKVVEVKLNRFFDQLGGFYPENLYDLIIKKVEKPLIQQILVRTGGNQLQAAQILGINRNTLRKKIKLYGI